MSKQQTYPTNDTIYADINRTYTESGQTNMTFIGGTNDIIQEMPQNSLLTLQNSTEDRVCNLSGGALNLTLVGTTSQLLVQDWINATGHIDIDGAGFASQQALNAAFVSDNMGGTYLMGARDGIMIDFAGVVVKPSEATWHHG